MNPPLPEPAEGNAHFDKLNERLQQVQTRIARAAAEYGRDPAAIQLLAVSKTRPASDIAEAAAAGQRAFGENYAQEALLKIQALTGLNLQWHFIGPLQSNKTRLIAENFAWLHSLDDVRHAQRLNHQRPDNLPPLNVCIEVNISEEAQKAGIAPGEAENFAKLLQTLPRLRLRGLMAIPAPAPDFEQQRQLLRALRELYQQLQAQGYDLDTLSMGMSDDLEAAVAEGSTLLRIGAAIFGQRKPPA
jgi:pyridoxal phosphate enzyme (YggS family)